MATTVQSRKFKGRRHQQYVRDAIIAKFPELTLDDCRSTSMGSGGMDIQLSPLAQSKFPFAVECKAQESVSIWSAWEQAKSNKTDKLTPLLVIKRNRSEPLVVMSFTDFMELV